MIAPWKRLLSLALVALMFSLMVISVPSSQAAPLPLKEGHRGDAVLELQKQLYNLGYLQTNPTGYFGPITTKSVIKLQADYQLKVDGIAGQQTNQLINKLLFYTAPPTSPNPAVKSSKEVLGFYVGSEPSIPASYATVEKRKDQITSISPFWYRLARNNPGQLEKYGNDTNQEIKQVCKLTQENNIKNYALIHNLLYGGTVGRNVLHDALVDPKTRWALVMNIYNLLKDNGFDGVCIDIEDMHAWDRTLYHQFLAELSSQLKSAGYTMIVCVPAKTTDKTTGGWGDNFDFTKVGRYADMVAVMAYDEHTAGSKAGPIASPAYLERVIKYALTKLPPEKILLGIAGYGFDWNYSMGNSRYISYQIAMDTAKKYGQSVQWSTSGQAPYFTYTDQKGNWHCVYFENSSSLAFKLDAVNKYNLKGVALWRLGMGDPDSWRLIAGKLGQ